jgi:protease-4
MKMQLRLMTAILATGICLGAPMVAAAQTESVSTAPASATTIAVLNLDGAYPELANPFSLFGGQETSMTFRDLLATVTKAKGDSKISAMVMRIGSAQLNTAQLTELHTALMDFRSSGKPLYATFESTGVGGYVLASAATEILIPPVSSLELIGMRADIFFYKDTLEKLGVQAQAINTGKFKTAFEPFTHNSMSEGTRIQTTQLLDDIYGTLVERVAAGRDVKPNKARRWLMDGPYTAKEALSEGLVDRIVYFDDFRAELQEKAGTKLIFDTEYSGAEKKKVEPPNLFAMFMGTTKKPSSSSDKGDKIALVHAIGPIVDGRVEKSPFGGSDTIASEDFIDVLNDVAKEPGVKAIVLRVDSPGGSAIASDLIWRRLEGFNDNGIPYVVSMGSVAASGGYYISMGADRVFAEPTTITGSIGVIGGRFILGDAYEKLGLKKEYIAIGENTGLMDESRPWTSRETKILVRSLDDVYDTFTSKAAAGRGMKQSRIKELGGGRVWSGTAALENGLIDELGGVEAAIRSAREIAKAPDAKVVTFPKEKTIMELFEEMLGGTSASTSTQTMIASHLAPQMDPLAQLATVLPPEHITMIRFFMNNMKSDRSTSLMVMPWSIRIR